jgi:hypothetical protein
MGLRFRRSVRVMPGVRVNLGLRGASLSVGPKGMTYNIGPQGSRVTVGLPGTGLSYSQNVSHQNPVALIANSVPQRRRYSLTPLVVVAFLLGLAYLASRSMVFQRLGTAQPVSSQSDIVGSISTNLDALTVGVPDPTVPLPRPRPKSASDPIGPPLQIVPK